MDENNYNNRQCFKWVPIRVERLPLIVKEVDSVERQLKEYYYNDDSSPSSSRTNSGRITVPLSSTVLSDMLIEIKDRITDMEEFHSMWEDDPRIVILLSQITRLYKLADQAEESITKYNDATNKLLNEEGNHKSVALHSPKRKNKHKHHHKTEEPVRSPPPPVTSGLVKLREPGHYVSENSTSTNPSFFEFDIVFTSEEYKSLKIHSRNLAAEAKHFKRRPENKGSRDSISMSASTPYEDPRVVDRSFHR